MCLYREWKITHCWFYCTGNSLNVLSLHGVSVDSYIKPNYCGIYYKFGAFMRMLTCIALISVMVRYDNTRTQCIIECNCMKIYRWSCTSMDIYRGFCNSKVWSRKVCSPYFCRKTSHSGDSMLPIASAGVKDFIASKKKISPNFAKFFVYTKIFQNSSNAIIYVSRSSES